MHKLIRDKYSGIIDKGELKKASGLREHQQLLHEKLGEEIEELREAKYCDVNEYADVIEVLYTLARMNDIPVAAIETARQKKRTELGGFMGGLILSRPE